ncbi:MAG: allophanate hydrolase [Burkholderiales bacterium]
MPRTPPCTIGDLHDAYRSGRWRPSEVVEHWLARRDDERGRPVWISTVAPASLRRRAEALDRELAADPDEALRRPVFGALCAVKDNIDVAGLPTTAACPAFAYEPAESAEVVASLAAGGAIVVGKTNLDQFATGLVGTRSPYGAVPNAFDARYVSGGSSSGSAVAVARGLVHVALGTDTAGSGRVPAAFNNIVGWKPTRGLLSTRGVVPACRSLDCVSVFALTVDDAARAVAAMLPARTSVALDAPGLGASFTVAVPRASQREHFGDRVAQASFEVALDRLAALGARVHEIDFSPWQEAAALLYEGPRVAERHAAIRAFFDAQPDAIHPAVRAIIAGGRRFTASDAYAAEARLVTIATQLAQVWDDCDVFAVPSAPTIYTIAQLEADPIELNRHLGTYTNFVNLLDLAAIAVPATMRADGLPAGITFIGPRGSDLMLAGLAQRFHAACAMPLGALGAPMPPPQPLLVQGDVVQLAVVGAHLSGMPLNHELVAHGARLVRSVRTSARYRLHALRTTPPKPGLVRGDTGHAIEAEVWEMSATAFGRFVAAIPPPLGIGTLELEDGTLVKGFLCEPFAIRDAEDISQYGGWRRYVAARTTGSIPSLEKDDDQAPIRSPA